MAANEEQSSSKQLLVFLGLHTTIRGIAKEVKTPLPLRLLYVRPDLVRYHLVAEVTVRVENCQNPRSPKADEIKLMGHIKDQLVEDVDEDRENAERALDDIEAFGDKVEWYVKDDTLPSLMDNWLMGLYSPNRHCSSRVCSKSCFARSCFDWCLTHSHPSVKDTDGTTPVTVQYRTMDAQGQSLFQTKIIQRRMCGHEDAREVPGDCNIVKCPFSEDELWELEWEQQMRDAMARDSP